LSCNNDTFIEALVPAAAFLHCPLGMSDHSVLKLDYKFNIKKFKTDDKFQLDKGCHNQLIDYLDINWEEMLESPNKTVDENWEDFKSILLKGMNMFIPKGKKSPIKRKKNFILSTKSSSS